MNKRHYLILCLLIPLNCWVAAYGSAEAIYSKFSPNIVFIESKLGTGTGFLLSENLIITNRHVIFGNDEKTGAWNAPKKIYLRNSNVLDTYEHVFCSIRVDLCVIKVPKVNHQINKILFTERKIRAGEEVTIIGHPNGIGLPIISKGLASSELARMPGKDVNEKHIEYLGFMTNAAISPGSSGSPVISSDGEVLGVAVGIFPDSQNLNVVISSLELSNLSKELIKNDSKKTFSLSFGYDKEMENFFKRDKINQAKTANRNKGKTLKSNLANNKKQNYDQGNQDKETQNSTYSSEIIRRILIDHLPRFRYCYQKELETSGGAISGNIILDFTISASGHVSGAGIVSKDGLPINVKKCVIGVLKEVAFPEPFGGGTVEVKQPMNFYPKGTN